VTCHLCLQADGNAKENGMKWVIHCYEVCFPLKANRIILLLACGCQFPTENGEKSASAEPIHYRCQIGNWYHDKIEKLPPVLRGAIEDRPENEGGNVSCRCHWPFMFFEPFHIALHNTSYCGGTGHGYEHTT
jgi:hypothetical protein